MALPNIWRENNYSILTIKSCLGLEIRLSLGIVGISTKINPEC